MKELFEKLLNISESIIDFPQPDLDLVIWNKIKNSYTIKPEVKKIILDTLKKYTKISLIDIADNIHITGSIGTNQFLPECDCDTHIITSEDKVNNAEDVQKDVFKFFREEENIKYIDQHPIEVYIQYNPKQELLAEACYDLLEDEWIKGPKLVAEDYDPYEDFSDIFDDVKEMAKRADIELGELKRDVIDYDTLEDAIRNLSGDTKKELLIKLKDKLYEIEDDIENLKKIKLSWINLRRSSSKPVSEEEALKDVKIAEKWRDSNAIFKFLSRYRYFKVISKMEQFLSDNKLEPDELNIIRGMLI